VSRAVVVAGVGNVFLGDDGFGVEVARRMIRERVPDGTTVVDVGIRSAHLAFDLASTPCDLLVLVDAVSLGGTPGTLYLLEVDPAQPIDDGAGTDAQGLTPSAVLAEVQSMGGALPRTRVVGCEPDDLAEGMRLSGPVTQAIEPAIEMIRRLIEHEEVGACTATFERGEWGPSGGERR
jgi:hydrogenase maturation protease